MGKEELSKRITKTIMIAPDVYIKQADNGDGTYTQTSYKRTVADLMALFEGTVARLQQDDGAQFPVPIIEEHELDGPSLGAIEHISLREMGDGKIGLDAVMLVEDEDMARRLTEGTLWTSPGVIYGGMLGVEGRIGDYIEELSIVSAPAQRDYKARELFSAKDNKLAPERVKYEKGVKEVVEYQGTVTATVEQLSKRLEELVTEKETLTTALKAETEAKGKIEADLKVLQDKALIVEVEQLKKDLAEKGLVAGEIDGIVAQVKKHPEDKADIMATVETMSARLTPVEGSPESSTVPGKKPDTAKDVEKRVEHLVEDFVNEEGVK